MLLSCLPVGQYSFFCGSVPCDCDIFKVGQVGKRGWGKCELFRHCHHNRN